MIWSRHVPSRYGHCFGRIGLNADGRDIRHLAPRLARRDLCNVECSKRRLCRRGLEVSGLQLGLAVATETTS